MCTTLPAGRGLFLGVILSLDDGLAHHVLQTNDDRYKSVYNSNHAFWATRPVMQAMVDWAIGDSHSLFAFREELLKFVPASYARCVRQNEAMLLGTRSYQICSFHVAESRLGRFMGKQGSNWNMRYFEGESKHIDLLQGASVGEQVLDVLRYKRYGQECGSP